MLPSSHPEREPGRWCCIGNSNSLEWESLIRDTQHPNVLHGGDHTAHISNLSTSTTLEPPSHTSSHPHVSFHRKETVRRPWCPQVQHDGNHIIHISSSSTSTVPPSASGSSNPHTSHHQDLQVAAASLRSRSRLHYEPQTQPPTLALNIVPHCSTHPSAPKRQEPGGSRMTVNHLGNLASHIPSDPSVPDFVQ
ncbi:hypothetical protein BS47DRAFT_1401792 [Hydnum rufescens UP504]|uniref:Uncharacterized protein n=1 Tax=Hydnum rufescens UP504 TaxID=1448309 RepID=A0A9P6DHQ5_9AGAM|nr:hypothetical protein BS47DRAFT_1401792 [Hydnum rufescens UP504]